MIVLQSTELRLNQGVPNHFLSLSCVLLNNLFISIFQKFFLRKLIGLVDFSSEY